MTHGKRGPPRKLHCVHGHAFTLRNSYFRKMEAGRIQRRCLTCKKEAEKRRVARQQFARAINLLHLYRSEECTG